MRQRQPKQSIRTLEFLQGSPSRYSAQCRNVNAQTIRYLWTLRDYFKAQLAHLFIYRTQLPTKTTGLHWAKCSLSTRCNAIAIWATAASSGKTWIWKGEEWLAMTLENVLYSYRIDSKKFPLPKLRGHVKHSLAWACRALCCIHWAGTIRYGCVGCWTNEFSWGTGAHNESFLINEVTMVPARI